MNLSKEDPTNELTVAWCVAARMRDPRMRDFVLFCRGVLSECVEQDKPDMLNTYMQLHTLFERCKRAASQTDPVVSAGQLHTARSEIGNESFMQCLLCESM